MVNTFILCNFLHKFLFTNVNMFNLSHDGNEMSVASETVPTMEHTSVESWEKTQNIMGCVLIAAGSQNFGFHMIAQSRLIAGIADDHRQSKEIEHGSIFMDKSQKCVSM